MALTSNPDGVCTVFGQLELFVPPVTGQPGPTVIVPVNVRNADGLRIGSSDIWLDFNGAIVESVAVSSTALTANYAWLSAVSPVAGAGATQRVKIVLINTNPAVLYGNGSLFWLLFKVKGQAGDISPLDLKDVIQGIGGSSIQQFIAPGQTKEMELKLTGDQFTVAAPTVGYELGDVNGDKRIAAADALRALELAVGLPPHDQRELPAADVNGNGHPDAADATLILYRAVHDGWPVAPKGTVSAAALHGNTTVRLSSASAQQGQHVVVTLSADNLTQIAGGNFTIAYHPRVVKGATKVTLTGLAANFAALTYQDNGQGLLSIGLSNVAGISGSDALLTIDFALLGSATFGDSPVSLASASLNNSFGQDFVTNAASNKLTRQSGKITVTQGPPTSRFTCRL